MSLKSFIVTEEVKVNHAERYLRYVERYHAEVFLDLKKNLEAAWGEVLKLKKAHVPRPHAVEDAQLRNPDALVELTLSDAPEKIVSSRFKRTLEVSPSLKVPLVYAHEERTYLIKRALTAAREAVKKTADAWKEIFTYEKNHRLKLWFKITEDDDEVRLQLMVNNEQAEAYRTLYAVRVEFGRTGTKTRDFDRVYLVSLV